MKKILIYDRDANREFQLNSSLALSSLFYPLQHNAHLGSLADEIAFLKPDLVILDTLHPLLSTPLTVVKLLKKFPEVKIFLQLNHELRRDILEFQQAGVQGYILRTDSITTLLRGIELVFSERAFIAPGVAFLLINGSAAGEEQLASPNHLTEKEKEVLKLLSKGMSYKMIASTLQLSYYTVSSHIRNMYHKNGVHSITGLLASCQSLLASAES